MTVRIRALTLVVVCGLIPLQAYGQAAAVKNYPVNPEPYGGGTPLKDRELANSEAAQQETAVSIINSLIDDSERYRDQTLRVRTQARAADALWTINQPRAREVFFRAWSTAQRVDEEGEGTIEEARKRALGAKPGVVTMIPPAASLRSEVLRLATRRDPALGDTLIAMLEEKKEGQEASSAQFPDPTEPALGIAKRLEVALSLLQAGETKEATVFAEPALAFATSPGIIFIATLRQKDAEVADGIFGRMLVRTESDFGSDATTVSLLSSYAFTPGLLVTATRRGRVSNQFDDPSRSYDLSSAMRMKFFQVAAAVLLRPQPPLQQDTSLAGRAGTYFTIARLLPLFERHAPSYLPALNAQLNLLASDAPETFRNGQDSMLRLGLEPKTPGRDTVPDILSQLDRAENSGERDMLYVKAIRAAATTSDPRIREYADKIEDELLRERARSFADLVLVRRAIKNRDVEDGLKIVRGGSLPPLQRVWALSQISQLVKVDRARATQLLEDAVTEANRIDPGAEDRVFALACVSSSFLKLDRFRSWSVAYDAVRATNSVPGFTGENARLSARLRTKNIISMISTEESSFTIANLFELLSQDDLQMAISLANGLKEESPRATATLAVAGSVLNRQKMQRSSRR